MLGRKDGESRGPDIRLTAHSSVGLLVLPLKVSALNWVLPLSQEGGEFQEMSSAQMQDWRFAQGMLILIQEQGCKGQSYK